VSGVKKIKDKNGLDRSEKERSWRLVEIGAVRESRQDDQNLLPR